MWSTTPAERNHLAIAMAHMLPSLTGINSAFRDIQHFEATFTHPARPLSTLRTPRCHDARKTRSRPVRYDFWSDWTSTHRLLSVSPAHSRPLLNLVG